MKKISILGSTGSIGTQALDVVRNLPDEFSVEVLAANSNVELFAKQVEEFKPKLAVLADENAYKKKSLGKCIDNLEAKFGKNIVKTGFYNNIKDI